jgi:hypothetical protein
MERASINNLHHPSRRLRCHSTKLDGGWQYLQRNGCIDHVWRYSSASGHYCTFHWSSNIFMY